MYEPSSFSNIASVGTEITFGLENSIISAFAFVPINNLSDTGSLISTSKSPSVDAVGEILVRVPSKISSLASVVTFTFCPKEILVIS